MGFSLRAFRHDFHTYYHSNFIYNGYITQLNEEDFFVKAEELIFTKKELKEMLDKISDELKNIIQFHCSFV